jgi:hypothetical protein
MITKESAPDAWNAYITAAGNTYDGVVQQCRLTRDFGILYGGKMSKDDIPPEIRNTHFKEHFAWRANKYAEVPDDVFESFFPDRDSATIKFCEGKIRSKALSWSKAEKKKQLARIPLKNDGVLVYQADITTELTLRSGRVPAAIITDPPYPYKFIDLWSELVKFAGRVLPDKGWLVAMSGQRFLPEVLARMTAEANKANLRYCWTIALHTPGQCTTSWLGGGETDKSPDVEQVGINVQWKPIFVFLKGPDLPAGWGLGTDFIVSPGNDKEYHHWGQNVQVFEQLISGFTQPAELVVDPFLGGGTTAIAAVNTGRAFEGFDIDELEVNESLNRLAKHEKT